MRYGAQLLVCARANDRVVSWSVEQDENSDEEERDLPDKPSEWIEYLTALLATFDLKSGRIHQAKFCLALAAILIASCRTQISSACVSLPAVCGIRRTLFQGRLGDLPHQAESKAVCWPLMSTLHKISAHNGGNGACGLAARLCRPEYTTSVGF